MCPEVERADGSGCRVDLAKKGTPRNEGKLCPWSREMDGANEATALPMRSSPARREDERGSHLRKVGREGVPERTVTCWPHTLRRQLAPAAVC
ncbi:unnamed protein product [Lampetra planeri]